MSLRDTSSKFRAKKAHSVVVKEKQCKATDTGKKSRQEPESRCGTKKAQFSKKKGRKKKRGTRQICGGAQLTRKEVTREIHKPENGPEW